VWRGERTAEKKKGLAKPGTSRIVRKCDDTAHPGTPRRKKRRSQKKNMSRKEERERHSAEGQQFKKT